MKILNLIRFHQRIWVIFRLAIILKLFMTATSTELFELNETNLDLDKIFESNLNENKLAINYRPSLAKSKLSLNIGWSLGQILLNANISGSCYDALHLYSKGIETWEQWAIQMTDATAEIPSGLLSGTKIDFGNYDQCLEVRTETFRGQYCMLEYRTPMAASMKSPYDKPYIEAYGSPPEWISSVLKEKHNLLKTAGLWLGACLPSTCTVEDVHNIYSSISKTWLSTFKVIDCQSKAKSRTWPTFSVVSKYLLILLFITCIFGSILDYRDISFGKRNSEFSPISFTTKLLKCFSLTTNAKNLFKVQNSDRNELGCFNGMRVLLSMWITFGHCGMYPEKWREMKYSYFYMFTSVLNWSTIMVENGFILIENFFVMSGFLMLLTTKPKLKKSNGNIDILEFIMQKYFRTMPVFLFVLLLYFIIPTIGSGPLWNSVWDSELTKCQKNGWMNLLLVHNFLDVKNICMVHSWFLSSLMQTQIVGLVLIILVYKRPKLGVTFGIVLVIICIWIDYKVSLSRKYPMMAYAEIDGFEVLKDYSAEIYFKPYNHFPSTLQGIVLCWYLLTHKNKQLPKWSQYVAWILSIVVAFLISYAIYLPVGDLRISAAYYAGRNLFWNLMISWVIYACVTGNASLLNRFLSMDIFIILNRISYNMYMIHPLVLLYGTASMRERSVMGKFENFHETMGILIITCILSAFSYIAVEIPFNKMHNSFFKEKKTKAAAEKTDK